MWVALPQTSLTSSVPGTPSGGWVAVKRAASPVVWTRREPLPSVTKPEDITLEEAPGSKKGCSLVTTAADLTGLTSTSWLRSIASSHENLSLHLSSKDLRSSEVDLLLCLRLLDFGESSERFFFLVGVDSTEDGLSVITRPNRVTSEGSMRVGVVLLLPSDFFCSPRSFLAF